MVRSRTLLPSHLLLITIFALSAVLTACSTGPGTTASPTTLDGKVKVGVIMPLSGSVAYCGIQARAGMEMAQDVLAANSRLQLIYEDDQFNPKNTVTAYQKLVQQDGVRYLIGSCNSSSTLAIAPLAERDHVLVITPASGSDKISQAGEYIFRTATSTKIETERIANFLASQGWKKVALYYLNNDYGAALQEGLAKELKFYQGEIVLAEPINLGDTDHRSRLIKAKGTGAEVIVSAQTLATAANFYRQLKDLKIALPVVSSRVLERSDLVEAAGDDAVEGTFVVSSTPWTLPNFQEKMSAKMKALALGAREERFVPLETPGGYDAVLAINDAVKKCGVDTACAKDWLPNPDYFNEDGAMGRLRFDNYGDAVRYTMVKVFKNGDLIPYDDTPKTNK